jgi:hypothetical protein
MTISPISLSAGTVAAMNPTSWASTSATQTVTAWSLLPGEHRRLDLRANHRAAARRAGLRSRCAPTRTPVPRRATTGSRSPRCPRRHTVERWPASRSSSQHGVGTTKDLASRLTAAFRLLARHSQPHRLVRLEVDRDRRPATSMTGYGTPPHSRPSARSALRAADPRGSRRRRRTGHLPRGAGRRHDRSRTPTPSD